MSRRTEPGDAGARAGGRSRPVSPEPERGSPRCRTRRALPLGPRGSAARSPSPGTQARRARPRRRVRRRGAGARRPSSCGRRKRSRARAFATSALGACALGAIEELALDDLTPRCGAPAGERARARRRGGVRAASDDRARALHATDRAPARGGVVRRDVDAHVPLRRVLARADGDDARGRLLRARRGHRGRLRLHHARRRSRYLAALASLVRMADALPDPGLYIRAIDLTPQARPVAFLALVPLVAGQAGRAVARPDQPARDVERDPALERLVPRRSAAARSAARGGEPQTWTSCSR